MLLHELHEQARDRLEPESYAYIASGADDEVTVADNEAAWGRYRLRPRMLRDVSHLDMSADVLGTRVTAPILVAPTAYHRLCDDEGECATVRGVAAAGSLMVVSTMSSVPLERVAEADGAAPLWFQLYVHRDRGLTESLVRRAESSGYRALVVTVDTPVLGNRRRSGPDGFVLPEGVVPANLGHHNASSEGGAANLSHFASVSFDRSLTPESITWLTTVTRLPVVVKGVLRGDDARACVDAGAAGVIVSNHGGRQLDTAVATADALGEVVDAVGADAEVYVDGGVSSGRDVLVALALGARAVFVGRPVLWGLTVGGADGVRDVLHELAGETELAFALAGVRSCADAGRDLLAPPRAGH